MNSAKPNNLKVALLVGTLNSGGAEKMMVQLANAFYNAGVSVDLLLVNKTGPFLKEVQPGVQIHNLSAVKGVKSVIFDLRKFLRKNEVDAVISTQPHVNSILGFASFGISKRPLIIMREASTPSHKYSGINSVSTFLYKKGYRFADHYVAVSEGVKKDMMGVYNLPESKITAIHNPVIDNSIEKLSKQKTGDPWFDDPEKPIILAIGRVVPLKNHSMLIKAFARVREFKDVRLVILGDNLLAPDHTKVLIQLIQDLHLSNHIKLPGFVPNPFSYLSRASLFVLSSDYEGLPGTLIQALACGCPVVSTDCPSGPAEILNNDRYGKLVPVGDVDAMTSSILDSLEEDYDKELLKVRANDFSAEKAGQKYLSLIEELLVETTKDTRSTKK